MKKLIALLLCSTPLLGFTQTVKPKEKEQKIQFEEIKMGESGSPAQEVSFPPGSNGPVVVEEQPEMPDSVFTIVEQMPGFPGGKEAFSGFIAKHIKYPQTLVDQEIEGAVYIKFIVHSNGNTSSYQVLRSAHPEFSKEALRVIKLMPAWIPGMHHGKKVPVYYTVPVRFKLQ